MNKRDTIKGLLLRRRIHMLMLLLTAFFFIASCTPESGGDNDKKEDLSGPPDYHDDPEGLDFSDGFLIVNYQRKQDDYKNFVLWLWNDTKWEGKDGWPWGLSWIEKTDFGVVYKVPLKAGANQIGFVPVDKKVGDAGKDAGDHIFSFIVHHKEIWVFEGDAECYISPDKELPSGITGGQVVSSTEIKINTANTDTIEASQLTIKDKNGDSITPTAVAKNTNNIFTVKIPQTDVKELTPFKVTFDGVTITASLTPAILDEVAYDGELGAIYNNDGSVTFKLWSPTASKVGLVIYDKNDSSKKVGETITMTYEGAKGLWSKDLTAAEAGVLDLKGYYYQYEVTNGGITRKTLDPYAKSMAAFYASTGGTVPSTAPDRDNIGKAAIVDLSQTTQVTDFANIPGYTKREDAVIYEVHIRDFTSHFHTDLRKGGALPPEIKEPTALLGTFKAFITNLDYIKDMGYTHIQLLPVMNFFYGDETNNEIETDYSGGSNNFNWGYDPHNYFTPEGMYSSDAKDPLARINELKELINEIHARGMGVILDVVYTHMAKAHFLADIVPNYYFFMQNGQYVGGFGNNLATTRKMARRIMVDSLVYWTKEYKVDGFRHDMMGDGCHESLMEAYDAVAKINPNTLFIGEGWRTFAGEKDGAYGADQDSMNEMNTGAPRIAVFSDEFRNLLKSGFGAEGEPRFITGGQIEIESLFKNIKGQPGNFNNAIHSFPTKNTANQPGQVVPYIAAHDNMTLHDIISRHIKKTPTAGAEEIHKRIRLGNLMVATTQGVAFFHAGQELGRTKQYLGTDANKGPKITEVKYDKKTTLKFVHDSYDSSDAVNQINWNMITEGKPGRKTMLYTKGLIALRKSTDAFRLGGDKANVDSKISKISFADEKAKDLVIAYSVKGSDAVYYVFINADTKNRTANLSEDLTGADVVVDADTAGTTKIASPSGFTLAADKITVNPLTAVIIRK